MTETGPVISSEAAAEPLRGDSPQRSLEGDEFGFAQIARSLAHTLSTRLLADGYALGLEGPWGSGKSTLANFIAEQLAKDEQSIVIRFEPWLFGDKNALIAAFFGQLTHQLDLLERQRHSWWSPSKWGLARLGGKLSKKIRKYGEYVGALAVPVGATGITDPSGAMVIAATGLKTAGIFSKFFGKEPSLEQLKSQIAADLRAIGKLDPRIRITVIMDDTDRLEANEAIELLRLVRKVADFPLTAYVVCFDTKILCQQINHAFGIVHGQLYIEKIFQDVIHIPPQEPFALRRYLRRLLKQSFPVAMASDANEHEAQFRREMLFDRWCGQLLGTPRDVVRLYEAVTLAWPYVPSGFDFFDFVWLQLLKLKWPELYTWTRNYLQNVGSYRDRGAVGETEPYSEAQALLELLKRQKWDERPYLSGLDKILPGLNSLSPTFDEKPQVFKFEQGELETFEQRRRLGSPSHWRAYFAFDLPSYALRDSELQSFRRAAETDPTRASKILMELLDRSHERNGHFLSLLLDRLLDEPAGVSPDAERLGMLAAFAETMDEIARRSDQVALYGHSEFWDQTRSILRKNPPSDLLPSVEKGKSINWLASILRNQGFALGLPEGHRSYPESAWLTREQLDECLRTLIARFERLGMRKIFKLPAPLDVLFCWVQLGDANDVRRRFAEATATDARLLRALQALCGWANSSNRGVYHPLHEQYVSQFADASEVKKRLATMAAGSENLARATLAKELLAAWESAPRELNIKAPNEST